MVVANAELVYVLSIHAWKAKPSSTTYLPYQLKKCAVFLSTISTSFCLHTQLIISLSPALTRHYFYISGITHGNHHHNDDVIFFLKKASPSFLYNIIKQDVSNYMRTIWFLIAIKKAEKMGAEWNTMIEYIVVTISFAITFILSSFRRLGSMPVGLH